MSGPTSDAPLVRVLARGRDRGFLGPGPIEVHIAHAQGFATVAEDVLAPPVRALDLGSGGGVPGLVLAGVWSSSAWILLEASAQRCAFLRDAVLELGMSDRVGVVQGRAEEVGHDAKVRATCDLVTARSFAGPAVTAECAAPFLRVGGWLVVSEPPPGRATDRWDAAGLANIGLGPAVETRGCGYGFALIEQRTVCSARYPRRTGVPAKRPLF